MGRSRSRDRGRSRSRDRDRDRDRDRQLDRARNPGDRPARTDERASDQNVAEAKGLDAQPAWMKKGEGYSRTGDMPDEDVVWRPGQGWVSRSAPKRDPFAPDDPDPMGDLFRSKGKDEDGEPPP